jgi:hypothetical protein
MLDKISHFLKYNNATVIILAVILILGGGALAAGPEAVGQKQTRVEGVDNSLLLSADLEKFSMDFKIKSIQADEQYYYVIYSFLDLAVVDNSWQYLLSERTRKISKKIKEDLGVYLAKFLAKHYEARLRELRAEQDRAKSVGEQKRIEVTEYSGLLGRTLDLAAKVFPGYEAVKRVELPAPDLTPPPPLLIRRGGSEATGEAEAGTVASANQGGVDNLTKIYDDYLASHDRDEDGVLDAADNCPDAANADQLDADNDGAGDICDSMLDTPTTPSASGDMAASTAGEANSAANQTDMATTTVDSPAITEPAEVEIIDPSASPPTDPASPIGESVEPPVTPADNGAER